MSPSESENQSTKICLSIYYVQDNNLSLDKGMEDDIQVSSANSKG